MPLTPQEQASIEAVCTYLSQARGKPWVIKPGPTLDDLHPRESSPEVLLTDGTTDAAVEVKRLGDDVIQPYAESILSLERSLAPSCGGYYTLVPCANLHFPLDSKLRRALRTEIARVAPVMQDGDERPIRIQRQALLVVRERDEGVILHCCHNAFPELQAAAARLTSAYGLLVDQDQMEHSFVTDEAREQFIEKIAAAARSGESQAVTWDEEWPLTRHGGDDNGVSVLGTSGAFDVQGSIADSTERMVEQAAKKFQGKPWAPLQIIALDSTSPHITADRVRPALSTFDADELAGVDLILLVDGGNASVVWSAQQSH